MLIYLLVVGKNNLKRNKMKQETPEEAAKRLFAITLNDDELDRNKWDRVVWLKGGKRQQKRSYSEEEVDLLVNLLKQTTEYEVLQSFRDKVEQFKKK